MKKLLSQLMFTLVFASSLLIPKQVIGFTEIIAFGDSLTDVGNVAEITKPGYSPVINGYYMETHFSDNQIWIEILTNYLGLPPRVPGRGNSTSLPPQYLGNTWAWGGSEAASGVVLQQGVTEPVPNLLLEVSEYLSMNKPYPSTLYTIWSGADNLLIGGNFGPKAAKEAVKAIEKAMNQLEAAGAKHILVFNMPKLGDTPSAQSGGKASVAAANLYAEEYNKFLKKTLKEMSKNKNFKAKIYPINVYKEFVQMVNVVNSGQTYVPNFYVPGAPVAISNVKDEALDYFNSNGTYPTNYLFWDDVHPTTQGHQVIVGLIINTFEPMQDEGCGCCSGR